MERERNIEKISPDEHGRYLLVEPRDQEPPSFDLVVVEGNLWSTAEFICCVVCMHLKLFPATIRFTFSGKKNVKS